MYRLLKSSSYWKWPTDYRMFLPNSKRVNYRSMELRKWLNWQKRFRTSLNNSSFKILKRENRKVLPFFYLYFRINLFLIKNYIWIAFSLFMIKLGWKLCSLPNLNTVFYCRFCCSFSFCASGLILFTGAGSDPLGTLIGYNSGWFQLSYWFEA